MKQRPLLRIGHRSGIQGGGGGFRARVYKNRHEGPCIMGCGVCCRYNVVGVFMRNWDEGEEVGAALGPRCCCCSAAPA